MDIKVLLYLAMACFAGFLGIVIAYVMRSRKNSRGQSAVLQKMMNQKSSNSSAAFYQKMYNKLVALPFVNRYVYKIRRRLELINSDDEYTIRNQTAKISLKNIFLALFFAILLCYINRSDLFMMCVSLIGVYVVIENLTEQGVSKVENRLLLQMLDFLSEVRHHFHTSHMVEEAVYDASLVDDYEIVSQANKIFEVLVSAEPELELERYYDVAPNRFLKAFAGVSYLTKEYGDRNINGSSLYLKDLNNITQELQMEVLKRDKLDYLFKSLTYIAVLPILAIKPLENWAMDSFTATIDFYEGKLGFLVQVLLLVVIFLCYALLTRIKDNGSKTKVYATQSSTWQERVYRLPFVERVIDGLMPAENSPKFAKYKNLIRDTASKLRLEWLYVNRCVCALIGFIVVIVLCLQMHKIAVSQILYSETTEGSAFGKVSEKEALNAKSMSTFDRYFIDSLSKQNEITNAVRFKSKEESIALIAQEMIKIANQKLDEETADKYANRIFKHMNSKTLNRTEIQYAIVESKIALPRENFSLTLAEGIVDSSREKGVEEVTLPVIKEQLILLYITPMSNEQAIEAANRIYDKLLSIYSEYFTALELAIAIAVAMLAFQGPIWMMMFQKRMRFMEMEDEVMQFQTIILMLMHIERISVETILEWMALFANIFKEPLTKCLNNYEAGGYEALEELKDDAPFKSFVRIVESLQAAEESVKITDAFDELESERNFFQEKRRESNERLINRKSKIGKVLGFAPMVFLFVGYLIGPLMIASLSDMGSYFTDLGGNI